MVSTVPELVDAIRQNRLLEPEQLDELPRLQGRFPDARSLARHLIQLGWLTPYQVNQIFTGKGSSLVMGSYIILERLGEGGMGVVFKARNWKLGRIVALKVIRREHVANNDAIRRFQREIRAVAGLSHPNVVAAYDADQVGDTHFFVMEYVDGTNLGTLVKEKGPPPVPLACEYIRQVALGLQQACERGMVHRDIKPANLLVQRPTDQPGNPWGPVVKILDMGVARLQQSDDRDSISALTKEGRVVGTPDYMAPEQAVNSAKADIRSDLYSLGCSFYHVITGQPPFPGGTPMEKLPQARMDQPKPIEQLRAEVPPAVAAIIRKLMAKKPEDRFQSPAELVQALENASPKAGGSGAAGQVSAGVPMAIPVKGPVVAGIPMAQPVASGPFQFSSGAEPARRSGSPFGQLLTQVLQDRKNWPYLIGAVVTLVLGVIFLIVVVIASSPRRSSQSLPPPDVLTLLARDLIDRPATTPAEIDALRRDLIRFRAFHPGTSQARGVARHLTRMPSPLDHLRLSPLRDRVDEVPAEAVAVLGDPRQRHWGPVRTVAFAPGGKVAASGGDDGLIRLWDPATMKQTAALTGHTTPVTWLAISGNGSLLASLAQDGRLRLWANPLNKPRLHSEPIVLGSSVRLASFSPDGGALAFAAQEPKVTILDLPAGPKSPPKPAEKTTVQTPIGQAIAYHAGTHTLAVATPGQGVVLFDVSAKPRIRARLDGHTGPVNALAFSDNGFLLATAGEDLTVRLWNNAHTAKPAPLRVYKGHTGMILTLRFAPNLQNLVSTSTDLTTRLWDMTGRWGFGSVQLTPQPTQWHNAAAFAANSQLLITGGNDATVRLWDLSSGQPREKFPLAAPTGTTVQVAFSPTGEWLATANDGDPVIRVWDLRRNRVALLAGEDGGGYTLAFAPDDDRLASCGLHSAIVNIWDLHALDRRSAEALPPQSQRLLALAFSPDGKILATSSMDRMIDLWNVAGPRPSPLRRLSGHRLPIGALTFSPDNRTLASASDDGTIRLWNIETGRAEQQAGTVKARALAFAPDGRTLAAGESDGSIRLWAVGDGPPREKSIRFNRRHTQSVTALHYLPDGESLLSAGDDGQLILHGPSSGQTLQSWRFPGAIRHAAVAVDGRHVATANSNGTVCILRIRPVPGRS